MPKRQPTTTNKKPATPNITHVLLKTNDELLLAALDRLESTEKENMQLGITATIRNGRKRIQGIIVCVGK